MYIDFDDYPPYTDAIYDIFATKTNSNINCCNVYPYPTTKGFMITWINNKIWEMLKRNEALTVVKYQKTTVRDSCEYADNLIPQSNEILDPHPEE